MVSWRWPEPSSCLVGVVSVIVRLIRSLFWGNVSKVAPYFDEIAQIIGLRRSSGSHYEILIAPYVPGTVTVTSLHRSEFCNSNSFATYPFKKKVLTSSKSFFFILLNQHH